MCFYKFEHMNINLPCAPTTLQWMGKKCRHTATKSLVRKIFLTIVFMRAPDRRCPSSDAWDKPTTVCSYNGILFSNEKKQATNTLKRHIIC